jgi:hypothetical protein
MSNATVPEPITDKRRLSMERRVALTLVRDVLAAGHSISVYDGGDFAALRCRDKRRIMASLASTDEDTLFIRDAAGNNLGVVTLVYGNDGWDVISDHTDTPAMNALLANVNAYADALAGRDA